MFHPLIIAVEDSPDTAYVLSQDLRLVHVNAAWRTFAEANGGADLLTRWAVGSAIADVLPPPLHDFYSLAFRTALQTDTRWEHEYECSSPTVYRRFRMFVYPVRHDRLLVVNSRWIERPHDAVALSADEAHRVGGFLRMCAHCRRTFNVKENRWDWVATYVIQAAPATSHGLCPPCLEYYFPEG